MTERERFALQWREEARSCLRDARLYRAGSHKRRWLIWAGRVALRWAREAEGR